VDTNASEERDASIFMVEPVSFRNSTASSHHLPPIVGVSMEQVCDLFDFHPLLDLGTLAVIFSFIYPPIYLENVQ
jgi:hypothetical protein